MTARQDDNLHENDESNRRIAAWFSEVIAASGRPQKEIARMLDLSDSAISRIKACKQNLSAAQLLILHERLGAPLPSLSGKKPFAMKPAKAIGARGATALFDVAYDQVREMNDAAPEERKMSQSEMLETVFHAMRRVAIHDI